MSATNQSLSGRLMSLDAYRGFIMLAMVSAGLGTSQLRGDPTWGGLANQLEHLKWEGCTFWDLIQPSFMFMVGVAMPFAFARRKEMGESWTLQFLHVIKRCILLCLIGIAMDSFAKTVVTVQFIRVLQQIAIGYFIAFLVLHLGPKGQALAAFALLALHTFAFWSYSGSEAWSWANRESNFGRELDRRMHAFFVGLGYLQAMPLSSGHYVTFNAISSAGTILIGVLAGELLKCSWSPGRKALILAIDGAILFGTGELLRLCGLPQVKRIWTASFALYAAGWTCWMMCVFYVVIDIIGWRKWAFPFVVVGVNSIFIYVSAGILNGTIRDLLKPVTYYQLRDLGPWAPVVLATLVMCVQWLLCLFLYRQRIFFKV
jgi:heparan-alpha-glucosaminide N-acetyltransferase